MMLKGFAERVERGSERGKRVLGFSP